MTAVRGRHVIHAKSADPSLLTILYLTNQLPFPGHSGGQLRESQLISLLGTKANVHLAVVTESFGRDVGHVRAALEHCASVAIFESVPARNSPLPPRIAQYESDAFAHHVAALALNVDLVHVEGYFLLRHLPSDLATPLVLVAENIERDIEAQRAEHQPQSESHVEMVEFFERQGWDRADVIAAMTPHDAIQIVERCPGKPVLVSPAGFDHMEPFVRRHVGEGKVVTFVGNYQWGPTRFGADRLVLEIWPAVHKIDSRRRLHLVGAGVDAALASSVERSLGVQLIGEVESVVPYLRETDVFVCPVNFGSGIMIKMIEAMAMGCAIVAPSSALRGLPETAFEAVMLAESNQDFVDVIDLLLRDPARREELSVKARSVAEGLPTWAEAADRLLAAWRLAASRGRPDQ